LRECAGQVGERDLKERMDAIAETLKLDPKTLVGPVGVTLAYFGVYYGFMIRILVTKIQLQKEYGKRGEKFDRYFGQDRVMLAADRTQLNMLEHMPVFLVLFWLTAFLVSSNEATWLGGIYTASRALYPVLLHRSLGREIPTRLMVITCTGYVVLLIMAARIAMTILL
jgi:uncharacterized membrane protein YecN with MAPEG domain